MLLSPDDPAVDINRFLTKAIQTAKGVMEKYWMEMEVDTSPFVATVRKGKEKCYLEVCFGEFETSLLV